MNIKALCWGWACINMSPIKSNLYQHVRIRQNYDLKIKALKSLFLLLQF